MQHLRGYTSAGMLSVSWGKQGPLAGAPVIQPLTRFTPQRASCAATSRQVIEFCATCEARNFRNFNISATHADIFLHGQVCITLAFTLASLQL